VSMSLFDTGRYSHFNAKVWSSLSYPLLHSPFGFAFSMTPLSEFRACSPVRDWSLSRNVLAVSAFRLIPYGSPRELPGRRRNGGTADVSFQRFSPVMFLSLNLFLDLRLVGFRQPFSLALGDYGLLPLSLAARNPSPSRTNRTTPPRTQTNELQPLSPFFSLSSPVLASDLSFFLRSIL